MKKNFQNSSCFVISFLLLFMVVRPAFADATDAYWLSMMFALQNTQLPNLLKQFTQLQTANTNLNTIQGYMSGDTGIENILNTQSDVNQRLWSNSNWQDVLNNIGGGNAQAFSQYQQSYSTLYNGLVSKEQLGQTLTDNDLIRTNYQQNQQISRAALASSEYSYNTINQHIQNIHDILAQLSQTQTEKASMDMNARLLAEVSYIQLEMLRQQNFQTQLMATSSQGQVDSLSDQAKFDQWNPTP